jgi:site-specific DNA-methyltransferase (adenine-specific)
LSEWEVTSGDNREWLKTCPDNHFDSCITDPPYGLVSIQKRFGKPGSAPAKPGTDGAFVRASKGFMGAEWDGTGIENSVEFWKEVLRVMKPGAHIAAFGGTRTFHRMMVAIEDAGFEIRDTIQVLSYMYGSGFPKSLSVSKALDRMAGAERKVVGVRPKTGNPINTQGCGTINRRPWMDRQVEEYGGLVEIETEPATDLAKEWDGYGTALKPSWEPIVIARKPLSESSVARNVQKWRTGAINIDACRVHGVGSEGNPYTVTRLKPGATLNKTGGNWRPEEGGVTYEGKTQDGRWPPNTLLVHAPGCRMISEPVVNRKSVKVTPNGSNGATLQHSDEKSQFSYDGTEPGWECVDGCAVKALGEQSGLSKSSSITNYHRPEERRFKWTFRDSRPKEHPSGYYSASHNDKGTAARFFPQFEPDLEDTDPFFYTSKPSPKEKHAGLDNEPDRMLHRVNPGGLENDPRWKPIARKNNHATVKPISLMRYLCKLLNPPGGRILDPFTGSGTTGCAAVLEGMDFVGLELHDEEDKPYATIARKRIEHWQRSVETLPPPVEPSVVEPKPREQLLLFDDRTDPYE